ncbi:hypothetical protein H4S01_001337 [Coemansia sp. RSA 2610]|nr:hypothetical protein H4S01_001337 [Coemansia sp. RSA 2610]
METLNPEILNRFINPDISRIPGVGDKEVSVEENEVAIRAGHAFMAHAMAQGLAAVVPVTDEPAIPASVGSYRIAPCSIADVHEPPYRVDDTDIQDQLNALRAQNQQGKLDNSLVVACAASVSAAADALKDTPRAADERIVVYICGGGFVSSDVPLLKWHYIKVSHELGQRVFVPRYHVAPTHQFPRAPYDVCAAMHYLCARGFRPQNMTFVCISAGGSVGLAALHLWHLQGRPMINGAVAIAPSVDLTLAHRSWRGNQDKCVLHYVPPEHPCSMSQMYCGAEAHERLQRHPLVSPLLGPLQHLPPVQVHVGGDDALHDEATELAARINEQQGSAELFVYPKRNHYTILRGKTQLDALYANIRQLTD